VLKPDSILVILDEQEKKIWLWQGRKTSFLARRMVMRTVQTIKRFGYEINGDRISDFSDIVIVDEKDFSKDEQQTLYETLKEKFLKASAAAEAAAESEAVKEEKKVSEPAVEELAEELPEPPEIPAQGEETPVKPPVEVVEPSVEAEQAYEPQPEAPAAKVVEETAESPLTEEERALPNVDIKVGLLISSVLKEFPEIYISVHGTNVIMESAEGTLTIFRILDRELELSPDFDFRGKQETIIAHYRDLLSQLLIR